MKKQKGKLKNLEENEGVSYSYSYKTSKMTKIATVPIGYADGVPRILSNKIYGLINSRILYLVFFYSDYKV